jgi:epoxyqueuosine reductase
MHDHCGTCTRCIDACPTDAIFAPYQLDASKCISYLTIELKSAIPSEFSGKMENWIFGCDICQDVCPWNHKFAVTTKEEKFSPPPEFSGFKRQDWLDLTREIFDELFHDSAVKRTGFEGFQRNIRFCTDGGQVIKT